MSKDAWMAAHEALVDEYMDANPDADWSEAYEATTGSAQARMIDTYADAADSYRQRIKDEQ